MSCYHPIKAFRTPDGVVFSALRRYDIIGDIEIPCGQCIGCRLRRAQEWTLRIEHESRMWPQNCFVTLTYGRDRLPPGGSLDHRDFQLFMKRLRKAFRPFPIRFFMCGEYGPMNLRPHFHACLFNVDFRDRIPQGKSGAGVVFFRSPLLEKLWPHGYSSVQDLNSSAASYCARYVLDKVTGDAAEAHYRTVDADGVIWDRKPEYCAMSLKPGIGATWWQKFDGDVYRHDVAVMSGREYSPPRYYDKLLKKSSEAYRLDEIEYKRAVRAKKSVADSTPERLAVREEVHKARVSSLKRSLE